jgi:predicted transcriptional regulator
MSESITAKERKRGRKRHRDDIQMIYRARTRTQIMGQILRVANGGDGATKTKLMYQIFLSHGQLKEPLMVLTQNGLLSYDLDTQTFKTTKKGRKFLEAYNEMNGMITAPPSV